MTFEELVKKYSKVETIYDDEAILAASEEEIETPYDEDTGKFIFYTNEGLRGIQYLEEILHDFGSVLGFSDHPYDLFHDESGRADCDHIAFIRRNLYKN